MQKMNVSTKAEGMEIKNELHSERNNNILVLLSNQTILRLLNDHSNGMQQ